MAAKQSVEKVLRQNLGKEGAAAMLAKIDQMARKGASTAAIEKAIFADLRTYIEQQVSRVIAVGSGNKAIRVQVKSSTRTVSVAPKISAGVSVKVGPGPMEKVPPNPIVAGPLLARAGRGPKAKGSK